MKQSITVGLIVTVATSAAAAAEPRVRRIDGLEWREIQIQVPKEELVRRILDEQHVRRLSLPASRPLVAHVHPDGSIEIRHAAPAELQSPAPATSVRDRK